MGKTSDGFKRDGGDGREMLQWLSHTLIQRLCGFDSSSIYVNAALKGATISPGSSQGPYFSFYSPFMLLSSNPFSMSLSVHI